MTKLIKVLENCCDNLVDIFIKLAKTE